MNFFHAGISFIRSFALQLREQIINQSTGSRTIHQKYHYDRMVRQIASHQIQLCMMINLIVSRHTQHRASYIKRTYHWIEIKETPFTLVITYPEPYGQYRLQTRNDEEIHRLNTKGTNFLNFFSGSNWKIHPEW